MTPFTKKYKFFVCSGFLVPGPSPAWDARMARSLVSSHGVVQRQKKLRQMGEARAAREHREGAPRLGISGSASRGSGHLGCTLKA